MDEYLASHTGTDSTTPNLWTLELESFTRQENTAIFWCFTDNWHLSVPPMNKSSETNGVTQHNLILTTKKEFAYSYVFVIPQLSPGHAHLCVYPHGGTATHAQLQAVKLLLAPETYKSY